MKGIGPTVSAVSWGENEVTFVMPESLGYLFKAGYTYEYVISGGFEG